MQDNFTGLRDLLTQLAALSDAHGWSWHAEYIRETAKAFETSEDAGWDHLASIQFWGGSGSICDARFSTDEADWHRSNNRPVPAYLIGLSNDDCIRDNTRFMKLLSEIAHLMNSCPVTEARERWLPRAKRMGEIYETWLADPDNAKIMRL